MAYPPHSPQEPERYHLPQPDALQFALYIRNLWNHPNTQELVREAAAAGLGATATFSFIQAKKGETMTLSRPPSPPTPHPPGSYRYAVRLDHLDPSYPSGDTSTHINIAFTPGDTALYRVTGVYTAKGAAPTPETSIPLLPSHLLDTVRRLTDETTPRIPIDTETRRLTQQLENRHIIIGDVAQMYHKWAACVWKQEKDHPKCIDGVLVYENKTFYRDCWLDACIKQYPSGSTGLAVPLIATASITTRDLVQWQACISVQKGEPMVGFFSRTFNFDDSADWSPHAMSPEGRCGLLKVLARGFGIPIHLP